jgi:hypothetical protein
LTAHLRRRNKARAIDCSITCIISYISYPRDDAVEKNRRLGTSPPHNRRRHWRWTRTVLSE